jgi:ABC-type Zn uptake system ZnuABC Zn-binding protein ZnuA
MKSKPCRIISALILAAVLALNSCAAPAPAVQGARTIKVLAVESFLADIAAHVAGQRLQVDTLMPLGMDPHAYQPTPQDVARIAASQVLIINGANFEAWLAKTLENAGMQGAVITASTGLTSRKPGSGEALDPGQVGDPHFWLDPNNVIQYVENIRAGLVAADPAGKAEYNQNAQNYIAQLKDLDAWIRTQVAAIPPGKRLLVTNHESFGYFADRYGFTIAGTVIPSTSSEASPSARQMAALIDHIKQSGVRAIFLETGANPQLAGQIAQETGAKIVTDLYTHSITAPGGEAPGYIEMMKHNVTLIVNALK